ncbi:1-acyl-sn-glycerol-3-phosphate acyltransferase [uncultured Porticoccus sp.]|uniref:1-acyl-sn-glycerol-3-phosphate acyltransferase n=1 Tax=uncultured Porticoccus sp. TaxID=1256050 RepID=UPI0026305959|nr:1-acyl-sn-glycerol-3-phosphate acyltransferase [uncultured Porticoccus sp.]
MNEFDDIRPYYDSEVPDVLARLAIDREFIDTLMSIKYRRLGRWMPWLMRPLISRVLRKAFAKIDNVRDFQEAVGTSMANLLRNIGTDVTVSGLDKLEPSSAYLYISNHRDIAMDPAFVNFVLYHNGRDTVRIAIGDNLLTKDFTSDLMRINKSFIVKRSPVGRREKLTALVQLSRYIRFSLLEERASVWIAQREGRAKDGVDKTEKALLKMLSLSKTKEQSFAEAIRELKVVPVAISYELDPLDEAKAKELYTRQTAGAYEKEAHEDLLSIYQGIVGRKGAVHVAFGDPLDRSIDSPEAMAEAVDRQIIGNYHLQPTNLIAFQKLEGDSPQLAHWKAQHPCDWVKKTRAFEERILAMPEAYREIALDMYANPVRSKLKLGLV